ncbi:MAG: fused MFS/spermidine synthase [Candidatus Acidiferrales bacterium]
MRRAPNSTPIPQLPFASLLTCFFLSGAAGLIYQVAWTKSLALLFGYTAYAVATVLAVFMGGLAFGSAWLGKRTETYSNPIGLYGWIELGVALSGALSLAGLAAVRVIYFAAYPAASGSRPLLLALRVLGAATVLFLPTFLMGGTLPILIRGVTRSSAELGARIGRFYAVNTLGAVAGTLAAGFVLLPWLGLRLTIACAVVLNTLAGAWVLLLSRAPTAREESRDDESGSRPVKGKNSSLTPPAVSPAFLLVCFSLVGATAIAYEIGWTRLLSTALGSSTYAFTIMLATFLAGIVLGSALFERWFARKRPVTIATFARTQLAITLAALVFLVSFRLLPNLILPVLRFTHGSFAGLLFAQALLSALAMLPAVVLFGFNFPAVVILIAGSPGERGHTSAAVGRAYAANTFGAIAAALLTGFFLLPRIGSFRVVALTASVNLLLATALELRSPTRGMRVLAVQIALLAVVILAGWSPFFYSRAIASYAAVLYGNYQDTRLTVEEQAITEDVVFFEDGLNATIAVTRSDDYVALKTNGKVDASNLDASTQLLLGDLGAIFHPHPQRVLIIGFGSGMTASAVARFPDVQRIDCVEIEPAVIRAAPHLERLNRGVLRDPRLRIIFDDARNFVQTSRDSYDLIISEPSNPWIAGIASLYTTEFYAALRKHLAPGGIFVQWVQAYALQRDDFRMILATLAPHFPDVTLWHSGGRDFLLLARSEPSSLVFDRSRALWSNPQLHDDFRALCLARPEAWPVYFRLNDAEVRSLATGAAINSDDRTTLEYRAPRALLDENLAQSLESMIRERQTELLPGRLEPRETFAVLLGVTESALDLNSSRAPDYVEALKAEPASAALEIFRGRSALLQNRFEDAIGYFGLAEQDANNHLTTLYWLAIAQCRAGLYIRCAAALDEFVEKQPRNPDGLRARFSFARDNNDWAAANAAQRKLLAVAPEPAPVEYCRLGDSYLHLRKLNAAEEPLRKGLQLDPYSFLCHRDLGELERATGRNTEAQRELELVVRLFPEADPKTYASLALVYRAEGKPGRADEILSKGQRIFPNDSLLRELSLKK